MEIVVQANKEKYNQIYKKGYDKAYPNLDLVRLERWYFNRKPGRILIFGFGVGVNLLHMLDLGYTIEGIEASEEAKNIVEKKVENHKNRENVKLTLFDKESTKLPYEDNSFDYVLCLSVLSLLGTRDRVQHVLDEFHRVLKPGAKMIVDINGPKSDFSKDSKCVGEDVFEYKGNYGAEDVRLCYCPQKEERFIGLLQKFKINDIGHASFKYMDNESFEYIACVQKPESQ